LVVRVRPRVSPRSRNSRVALLIACLTADALVACLDDRELGAAPVFGLPLDASGVLEADIPTEGGVVDDGSAGQAGSGAATSTGGRTNTGGRFSTGGALETGGLDGSGGEGGVQYSTGGVQTGTGGAPAGSGGATGGIAGTGGTPVGTGGVVLPSTGGRPSLGECSGPDGVGGDCGATLVQNATFDSDVAHWDPESSSSGKWRASNWSGTAGGSMTVTNALCAFQAIRGVGPRVHSGQSTER
jgi:hypothetical protein